LKLAKNFLQTQALTSTAPPDAPTWQYGWGEFDEKSKRLKRFQPLPHFTKYAWQGSTNLPDPKLGWVLVTAEGGHPGNDLQHAAVRRWIAPRDGTVSIQGELEHPAEKGDGVRARIITSRKGPAGEWAVFNQKANTNIERIEVNRGDTIDFVTDCRSSVEYDSFTWSPVIKYTSSAKGTGADSPKQWSAKADFTGPPKEKPPTLGVWEKYAQVLLLSNELVFVD
jgi:hypothetical protein